MRERLPPNLTTLLVDLDNTLHDYEAAANIARRELAREIAERTGAPENDVLRAYLDVCAVEPDVRDASGLAMRRRRVGATLGRLRVAADEAALVQFLSDRLCAAVVAFEGAIETLKALSAKYQVVILTEGYEDTQRHLFRSLGEVDNIPLIGTSTHHVTKRDGSAHRYALNLLGVTGAHALMIGDDWDLDIVGAARASMPSVWVSHGRALPVYAAEGPVGAVGAFVEISSSLLT